MFLSLGKRPALSLPLHLTLWYAGIFTISSVILFSIIYIIITSVLHHRMDDELIDDVNELSAIFHENGMYEFHAEMQHEVGVGDQDKVFYRLLDNNGNELLSTDISGWPGISINKEAIQHVTANESVFKTVSVAGHKHQARIVYGSIDKNHIIQIGFSLEDNDAFLGVLRNIFVIALPLLMFVAGFLGWFMSKKALQGVNEVTEAAIDISQGELDRRVPQSGRGDELDKLAITFNGMLDRIQTLIKSMLEMTDNIAHDLRSPLARIRGMAETSLTNTSSINDFQSMAADTVEECDRLLHMINTMLDITETEAGVANPGMSSVNLSEVVIEACELFEPTAEDKAIKLTHVIADKIIVYGNIHYLQRLISNLIDNAIKYTNVGDAVGIELRCDFDHAVLIVQDTGIGIEAKDLESIFKRFYRCDTSRSQPGSGLGLSLALAIAHLHKGDIRVESIPGRGSTFIVTLPLAQKQEQ